MILRFHSENAEENAQTLELGPGVANITFTWKSHYGEFVRGQKWRKLPKRVLIGA